MTERTFTFPPDVRAKVARAIAEWSNPLMFTLAEKLDEMLDAPSPALRCWRLSSALGASGRFRKAAPHTLRVIDPRLWAESSRSPRSQTHLITMTEADLYIPRVRLRTRLQNPLNSSGFVSP